LGRTLENQILSNPEVLFSSPDESTNVRNAWNLLIASQIVNIGFGLIAIFIPLLATEIHLRPSEIGLIISIFMVSRALAAYKIPALSDKLGRKTILIVALLTYAVSTVLLGFARDFWTLFLLRVIEGAATGAAFPTAEALLVDSVPQKDRGGWRGKYFTTFNLGFVIGPAMGGILFFVGKDVLGFNTLDAFALPFVVTGLLGLCSLIAIVVFVSDVLTPTNSIHKGPQKLKESGTDESTPFYSSFMAIALINGFAIGMVIPIFALYIGNDFSLEPELIGFIFTISGTVSLMVNYPMGKLSDKVDRMLIVLPGMMLATLAFLGVGLATSLLAVVFFFILRSIAIQAFIPAYRAFQADKIPAARRGEVMGKIQWAFNIGAFFGPLVGAWLYELYEGKTLELPGGYSFFGGGVPFIAAALVSIFQVSVALYILKVERAKKKIMGEEFHRFPTVREILDAYCSACGTPGFLGSYETCEKCGAKNAKEPYNEQPLPITT
jgi:DHA1 family quinolone resistance protein-like MFS transporter